MTETMTVAEAARLVGLPEDRVAQMAVLIRSQGMEDGQMASMMFMALGRGLTADEVSGVLATLGVAPEQIARVRRLAGADGGREETGAGDCADVAAEGAEVADADGVGTGGTDADGAAAKPPRRRLCDRLRAYDWAGALKKLGVILFWLLIWEAADHIVDNRLVLAGPVRVGQALIEQMARPEFWLICGATTARIAAGFLLAFVSGCALALLSYRFRVVRAFVDPIISLLKTVPMASFVIMLLIWVGTQMLTVYLSFLIVVPIVYTNMLAGLESVSANMVEMARAFRLSRSRRLWYIYRPAFMPFLYSSCKLSLGMSWKAGIMAEVLAVPLMSIGKEMYTAKTFLDTPDLLAWTVVVMVLALIFEKVFLAVLDRAGRPMGHRLGVAGSAGEPIASARAGAPLSLEGLSKSFGDHAVLRGVSLSVDARQPVCLMAPSGSGKTTLFRVMLGLERPDGGTVRGIDEAGWAATFQEDRLSPTLSAVDNVALVLPKHTSRAAVRDLLAEVLPARCLNQPVMELSGGMRRRVALVRALAFPSANVVLDEPFTGLDAATRREVIAFIGRHGRGRNVLVATHGEDDAALLGARLTHLDELQEKGVQ